MPDSFDKPFDVAIVGAGVAGTAAAILLAQAGLSVVLLERKREIDAYKTLCTHFIQPFANNIFHRIGLGHLLESAHSVKTKAAFHVPGGIIDVEGGYGGDNETAYAHNLERRVLDPALRQRAIEAGVTLALGFDVAGLDIINGGHRLTGLWEGRQSASVSARFIAVADGRQSRTAALTGAAAEMFANDRAAYFCYCSGIAAPAHNRSIFVLDDNEMSFLYPLIEGRTLLSVYVTMERSAEWKAKGNLWPELLARFAERLPGIDFSSARLDTQMYSYRRYDNQIRPAVAAGVALLGDTAASLDPMSGVGCSFALKSADLFAAAVLAHTGAPQLALDRYAESHAAFFKPHISGIVADSRVAKSSDAVERTYATILQSPALQQLYLDLTARLIAPDVFQRAYLRESARALTARVRAASA